MNVLIDLDGTLTDPAVGMVSCLQHALRSLKRPALSDEELKRYIGPPIQDTFKTLLGSDEPGEIANAVRLYRERYSAEGLFQNTVYPGIPLALQALRQAGAKLYLATSKPQVFAERILAHFGLEGQFKAIHGSGLDGTRADKSELIAYILKSEVIAAGSARMVGDRSFDVVGAKANSVRAIGVLWGYGSRQELMSAGASALCEKPALLPQIIQA